MSEGNFPYPLYAESGNVICQVCGRSYGSLTVTHIKTHKITKSEYEFKYPGAPFTSKTFGNRKTAGIRSSKFIKEELEKIEKTNECIAEDTCIEELDLINEPIIEEEIGLDSSIKTGDIFSLTKDRILDHLRLFLDNIKKDYQIIEYGITGNFIFQCITDFADPVLKVNIEFPNAGFHNKERFIDPQRNQKLIECGWRVVEIESTNPSFEDIKKMFEK